MSDEMIHSMGETRIGDEHDESDDAQWQRVPRCVRRREELDRAAEAARAAAEEDSGQ